MKINDIMHNIIKVPPDIAIMEAAKLMDQKGIGSLVVEESGEIVGIMTERDILKKVVAAGRRCEETIVKDIMTSPLITIDLNDSIEEASELMAVHHIRRLVVTEKSEVVGIITSRDLVDTLRYSLSKSIKDLGITNYRPDYSRDIAKNTNN